MTITSDQVAPGTQPAVAVPDDHRHLYDGEATSIDALFREAKRRRRRRQAKTAAGLALVLLAATIGIMAGRGGTHRSPPAAVRSGRHPGAASSGTRARGTGANVPAVRYTPMEIGQADRGVVWGVNGGGVFLTTNAGRTWRTITPPPVKLGDPVEDVPSVVGVGAQDLWIPVNDVFGIVPPADAVGGFDRAQGIERSTNGGRTWTFDSLEPGCFVSCGPDSLSFVDPSHGFATNSSLNGGSNNDGSTTLFSTNDGGVTWRPVGPVPGGGAHDISFTSTEVGWTVTGVTYGTVAQNEGRMTDAGGTLYRTTDGGATWSPPAGLPVTSRYELPTFFNRLQGLVLGEGPRARLPVVYVTDDGGATWTAHRLPRAKAVATYAAANRLPGTRFPLGAVSPWAWKLYIGPTLYTTSDAGRHWTSSVPRPRLAAGTVFNMVFSSAQDGLATALAPGCLTTGAAQGLECYESLFGTTDGGQRWKPLRP
jgi:photosystem II stability/assembly factor-like uncharacterized protein